MSFIPYTKEWVKGEILQGKVMVVAGLLLVLCLFFIFKNENTVLKGMFMPIALLMVLNLGYGSFVLYSRPKHLEVISKLYQQNRQEAIQKELIKAQADNKNYTTIKPIWAIFIVTSTIIFFFIKNEYYKGLTLGLIFLFVSFLLIDTLLHHRLKPYLEVLIKSTC
jgi:hypothetical protein